MKLYRHSSTAWFVTLLIVSGLFVFGLLVVFFGLINRVAATDDSRVLITVHDRGQEMVFLTDAQTIGDALEEGGVIIDENDAVEPSVDEKIVASDYQVNIYRARPVTVVDGATRQKVMTPFQSAKRIAESAGIELYDEDETKVVQSSDIVGDGVGLQLIIDRATPVSLDLYGSEISLRTQSVTVADLLQEKGIVLTEKDGVSPDVDTPITQDMDIRVWREGKQTITVEESVDYDIETIKDADRNVGYKEIKTAGETGQKTVTYEIEIRDGVEVSRNKITEVVTKSPKTQVEVVGMKTSDNPLTKSMGVNMFTDSDSVTHRETYYDLDMSIVAGHCGNGGYYTVRGDGAKVDRDGYVLVAASLTNYPRCSVVETSLGLGKVYDTGEFTKYHPLGFDLATDWTRADGI